MLQTLLPDGNRTFDLDSATQQPRLPMHLVTGEGTVAATDAQVHVHHQDICAVDNSGRNLFFRGLERVEIGKQLNRRRRSGACDR